MTDNLEAELEVWSDLYPELLEAVRERNRMLQVVERVRKAETWGEIEAALSDEDAGGDRDDVDPPLKDKPWWSVYQPRRREAIQCRLLRASLEQAEARADREMTKYWTAAKGKIQAERERDEARALLREARFLALVNGPERCPEWEEGVGDCEKPECMFCRIQRLDYEADAHLRGSGTREGG